jgi:hypothetical protein
MYTHKHVCSFTASYTTDDIRCTPTNTYVHLLHLTPLTILDILPLTVLVYRHICCVCYTTASYVTDNNCLYDNIMYFSTYSHKHVCSFTASYTTDNIGDATTDCTSLRTHLLRMLDYCILCY